MRVTTKMMIGNVSRDLFRNTEKLSAINGKVASQKEIARASDNPIGMGQILDYRTTIATIDQYQENISQGKAWLEFTESTLDLVSNLVSGAREVAGRKHALSPSVDQVTQGGDAANHPVSVNIALPDAVTAGLDRFQVDYASATGTWSIANGLTDYPAARISGDADGFSIDLDDDGKADINGAADGSLTADASTAFDIKVHTTDAAQIEGLYDQILGLANTKLGSNYIFAGHQTDAAPYSRDADYNVHFAGDDGAVRRIMGPDETVQINAPGNDVFNKNVDVFSTLRDLIGALEAGDETAIGILAEDLETALNQVNSARIKGGPKLTRLQTTDDYWSNYQQHLQQRLSQTEDTDMATAILELKAQETAYETALSAAARVIQSSLIKFL
jgi:flagellin-like hook-associated protein FlgL